MPPPASKFLVPWVYKGGAEAVSNRGWIRQRVSGQAFLEAKEREQLMHVACSFVSPPCARVYLWSEGRGKGKCGAFIFQLVLSAFEEGVHYEGTLERVLVRVSEDC